MLNHLADDFVAPNIDLLSFQASMINGISGAVFQPNFRCPEPATECYWEELTTLAVCGDIRRVTNVTTHDCNGDDGVLWCTYNFTGRSESDPDLSITFVYSPQVTMPSMLFRSFPGGDYVNEVIGTLAVVNVTGGEPERPIPPPTEVYYSTWFWCAQTFQDITASSSGISQRTVKTERLTDLDTAIIEPNDPEIALYSYQSNSTGMVYQVTMLAAENIFSYLGTILNATVYDPTYHPIAPIEGQLDIGGFLSRCDLNAFTQNLANTLTNQIRSSNPGDNANATTVLGQALYKVTFVKARWPWLIVPLIETLLTTVLLAVSIMLTRQQPLLKNSVVAFLVHGLEGWSDNELEVPSPETMEQLENMAEHWTGSLDQSGQGRLKFLRS